MLTVTLYTRAGCHLCEVAKEDLAALGSNRGIPAGVLKQTIDTYNQYIAGQAADPFGRNGDTQPLAGNRWILLGPAKAYFTTTEGSIAITTAFEVLSDEGAPIEGLYAIGTCGLGGMILWGHGLHIAWAFTSGRMLGEQLAGRV